MKGAVAKKTIDYAGARLNRITSLEKKLETANNPIRQVWLRHLIDRNQRKFDKAVAPHINKGELKGAIDNIEKPVAFFELREIAVKEYLKAWENAMGDAEHAFITEGKTASPLEFFIKPASVERYEQARQLLAMKMGAEIPQMDLKARAGRAELRLSKTFILMTASMVAGAVAGYILSGGFWGAAIGYFTLFGCSAAIAGHVGKGKEE